MISKQDFIPTISNLKICPKCKGTGWIVKEHQNERTKMLYGDIFVDYAFPCPCCNGGHDKNVIEAKENADIPNVFYNARLKDFDFNFYKDEQGKTKDLSAIHKAIDSFVNDFDKWSERGYGFYFYSGLKGTGKTFLASCICNELMNKYAIKTKYVSYCNLIALSKAGKEYGSIYDRDPIQLLCDCPVLVIDDLGAIKSNEWIDGIMFRIVDTRMNNKKITIYTSNKKLQEHQMNDDRIIDRINATTIQFAFPEYSVRCRNAIEAKRDFLNQIGVK